MNRLRTIQNNIQDHQILLISTPSNLFWSTGFTGSNGIAIISKEKGIFITDPRYILQAEEEVIPNHFVVQALKPAEDLKKHVWNQIKYSSSIEVLFENEISYSSWKDWTSYSDSIKPMDDLLHQLRLVKTPEEIQKMKEAAHLIDQGFEHIQSLIKPGTTEKEIELELDLFLKRSGSKFSFDPIVVSGFNSAKPHGKATQKILEQDDLLTIDAGAKYQGYCSDLTRTFIVGQASQAKKDLYNAVLEAQNAALDLMRPGVLGKEVDAVAREVLKKHNLDQYFGHGLGHSLGVDVHDGYRLNPHSETVLAENQVWTVEPGAYIPGFGGVRIEDDVVITSTGIEILTQSPK